VIYRHENDIALAAVLYLTQPAPRAASITAGSLIAVLILHQTNNNYNDFPVHLEHLRQ
jgi:hypothetical protein